MKSTLSKALAAFALGVLGMLAFVGPSHAARFIAHIDPVFGGSTSIKDMGFRGDVEFYVPDACLSLSLGDGFFSNFASSCTSNVAGGRIAMTSATVQFYDDLEAGKPTLATAVFGSSFKEFIGGGGPTYVDLLIDVLIVGGTLVGVNSDWMPANDPVVVGNVANFFYSGPVALKFTTPCEPFCGGDPAFIQVDDAAHPGSKLTSNPSLPFTFTQIPEPTTLSLLLAALGASVFVQRRRRSVG